MNNKILTLLFAFILVINGAYANTSEAEYKVLRESWSLNSDGSQEFRSYKELTLFTHTAMNATYGETFIVYNPNFQEVKIHDSYTIQTDGSKVITPENAFTEVLPRNAQNAAAYNHLKELVVVHTGLELGATIVLDYSIITKPGYLPEIDVCKQLSTTSPIKSYTLTFSVPANKPLHYESIATSVKPILGTDSDKKKLVWNFKKLSAASREPMVSVKNGDVASIFVNSYSSTKDALKKLDSQFTTSSEVEALAKKLTSGMNSEPEKIKAIINYIKTNIAPSALTLSETNNTLRSVNDVINSAYGTAAEQVALLNAMLNAAGVKSSPAAAYNIGLDNLGLCSIEELLVITNNYRLTPKSLYPAASNAKTILTLSDAEKVAVNKTISTVKFNSTINWVDNKPIANTETVYTGDYLPCVEDANSNITKEDVKTQKSDEYTLLHLPTAKKGVLQNTSFAKFNSERTKNLGLNNTIDENYSYTIELPSNLELSSPQIEKTIENKVGKITKSIKVSGNIVNINFTLKVNKDLITPADYPNFRKLMVDWNDTLTKPLLFE